jgi:protein SCO1
MVFSPIMRLQRLLLSVAVLTLAAVLAWLWWFWEPQAERGHRPLAPAAQPTGGDFHLSAGGTFFDLQDLRGKVVLLYFGYTWCPDICPTNLAYIAAALKTLSTEELARVQVVFVSVDPERDVPQRLAEYAGWFHPQVRGVTGTPAELAAAARLYGVAYRRVEDSGSAMGYLMDHSAYTYVVDPQGRLVRILNHATLPADIAAAIRSHLGSG